jgi:hypothetical protein
VQLVDFQPENELERAILGTKQGIRTIDELMNIIAISELYVSSKRVVHQDGSGFEPLLLGQGENPLVATFSSLSRPGLHRHMAEYVLQIKGREFFLRLPPNYGVILNPGYAAQLIIPSRGISELKKQLKQA